MCGKDFNANPEVCVQERAFFWCGEQLHAGREEAEHFGQPCCATWPEVAENYMPIISVNAVDG